jgi:hypothetical protein
LSHASPGDFPIDYFSARDRFLALADTRGARVTSYPLGARGPGGESLSIDAAYLGAPEPRRLLLVSSGVHGVEGFAGSAVQQRWLETFDRRRLGHECGCLLVHAVNPWGFAWRRRVNEHNVDLNRNALERFPGPSNVLYRQLDALLNPRSPPRPDGFLLKAAWLALRLGLGSVRQAAIEGQYEFPRGLFYGGEKIEESIAHVDKILGDKNFRRVDEVLALDVHTGLGRFGTCTLLVDFPQDSPLYRDLARWFGPELLASSRPKDALAYPVSGGVTDLIARRFAGARAYVGVLELGTISALPLFLALRLENRAHHTCEPNGRALERARARLREAFAPTSTKWQRQVLARGERVLQQAEEALLRC